MELENELPDDTDRDLMERRFESRFNFEVDITVRSRNCGLVKGHCLDISQSGISAMLTLEIPSDEMVELVFVTPFGPVTNYAMLRQRSAFRYGFQFVEPIAPEIGLTCRYLAKPVGGV